VKLAEHGYLRHVIDRDLLAEVFMHRLDDAFNGLLDTARHCPVLPVLWSNREKDRNNPRTQVNSRPLSADGGEIHRHAVLHKQSILVAGHDEPLCVDEISAAGRRRPWVGSSLSAARSPSVN
jgi:hypothetical protein